MDYNQCSNITSLRLKVNKKLKLFFTQFFQVVDQARFVENRRKIMLKHICELSERGLWEYNKVEFQNGTIFT